MDELLLAPEIYPDFGTVAFLIDMHFFQTSKSSEQKLTGRWHSRQVLLIPVLKGLEAPSWTFPLIESPSSLCKSHNQIDISPDIM